MAPNHPSGTNSRMILRNASIGTSHPTQPYDVAIEGGIISAITPAGSADATPGCITIDCGGMLLLPGLVDLHVHLREPGFGYKETISGGTEAAARGGFTTVCSMPNLSPAPDSIENLKTQLDIISRDSVVETIPYATITKARKGNELVDYQALAPYVAGFSDDGSGVQDAEVMEKAMRGIAPTGKILAAHCEVESLLHGGYIHDGEYCAAHGHKGICSESEWAEVERDIRLAEATGCRLHICHMSTAESVGLVRDAKKRGVKVTCETGPHYLMFCDEDMKEHGRFKMNPPLRARRDMEALRNGVADGTIDCIATDHAPHADDEKARGLAKSAMGVVGLETSFAAVFTSMVKSGRMPLSRLIDTMCVNPRHILGRPAGIEVGMRADLALFDTDLEWTVDASLFAGHAHSTPFDGLTLTGKPVMTIFDGKIVYSILPQA